MKPAIPTESGITESKNTIDKDFIYGNIIVAPAPTMGARSSFVLVCDNVRFSEKITEKNS